MTAYYLSEANLDVTVVEKNSILSGITSKLNGKICLNQGIFHETINNYGYKMAKNYYDYTIMAQQEYKRIISELNIDCEFKKEESYLYSITDNEFIKNEKEALESLDKKVYQDENFPLNLNISNHLKIKDDYTIDIFKFLSNLPFKFKIYENACATKIGDEVVINNMYHLTYDKLIVCTNMPPKNSKMVYKKTYASTAYTSLFKGNITNLFLEDKKEGLSIRNFKGNVVLCGLDHDTGYVDDINKFKTLHKHYETMFKKEKSLLNLSNQDVMSLDKMPLVIDDGNVITITAFNKWGLTNSIICAKVTLELINDEKFINPFAINRFKISFKLVRRNIGQLLKGTFNSPKIELLSENNNRARCRHQNALLKYNTNTNQFECTAHGSTYSKDGEVKNGPAI